MKPNYNDDGYDTESSIYLNSSLTTLTPSLCETWNISRHRPIRRDNPFSNNENVSSRFWNIFAVPRIFPFFFSRLLWCTSSTCISANLILIWILFRTGGRSEILKNVAYKHFWNLGRWKNKSHFQPGFDFDKIQAFLLLLLQNGWWQLGLKRAFRSEGILTEWTQPKYLLTWASSGGAFT